MSHNPTTPTVDEFKRLAADVIPAVRAVLLAQAYAELKRIEVDAYIRPIFERYNFQIDPEFRDRRGRADPVIRTPRDLYLVANDDPELKAFYMDCDDEHRRHGFDGPPGHCPALRAEHLHNIAERCLIDLTAPKFGIDPLLLWGDSRKKFLDLMIGAGVQAAKDAGINLAEVPR